jgi:uncharacterized membrane protein
MRRLLTPEDLALLEKLRRSDVEKGAALRPSPARGDRIADVVTGMVGSWRFVIAQSALIAVWIAVNLLAWSAGWDPYPFILLNLLLSFQAAYTAPIIMMSQNRQAAIDRQNAETDYRVNVKAELEIELLHEKLDLLREQEIVDLLKLVTALENRLAGLDIQPAPAVV